MNIQKIWIRITFALLLLVVIQSIHGYYIERNMIRDRTLKSMEFERDSIIRNDLESKIIQESKITYTENFKAIPDSILFLMVIESDSYKIPHSIFFRIMERESKFLFVKNKEGSSALGYMQIIKSTFNSYYDKLELTGGHTATNNIKVAACLIDNIHGFWRKQFKDKRTAWEYTVAEYGCGRGPLLDSSGVYSIPDSIKSGINYVMRYYK